jgi:hypothetical protein
MIKNSALFFTMLVGCLVHPEVSHAECGVGGVSCFLQMQGVYMQIHNNAPAATDAPAASRIPRPPVQIASLETQAQSTRRNANRYVHRFRLATETCGSDDGSMTCTCPKPFASESPYCCSTFRTCYCSAWTTCEQ